MKRFLPHEELARDRRFRRSRTRNELLRSLPDDVPTIVRTLEQVAPKIRARVAGTALEPVFDELGPGFTFLTTTSGSTAGGARTPLQLRLQLHGIFVGELQALEAAGRTLWDFPDAPWEFKMNMARQCWDEARHVQAFEKLIEHVGGEVGEFPENTFLYEVACAEDPVLRVAGVNRCLEGLACDAFRSLIEYGREAGDEVLAQALDFVLADELTHVRFGSAWVREFTRDDPERAERTREFQRETDRRFAFGGGRYVAREDRREAGFTDEELAELDEILGEGPQRETLVRAAELLRDRHQARQRGEPVPPLDG
ncbi:MAG: DUF455 family protein [Myxococcota bacterium]|nr:DUF455 family protein [Myxococcota bacterium]